MPRFLKPSTLLFFTVAILNIQCATRHVASVGISGEKFTLNGRPTFLLGVSYFDALGWKISDLDLLQSRGFNLIRVWLDWAIWKDRSRSFFNPDGTMKNTQTILDLVRAAAARGIVVDVTILSSCSVQGGACASSGFKSRDTAKSAIRTTVDLLKNEPNVFFDLVNERDNDVGLWTDALMADLVGLAKQHAPNIAVTFSDTGDLGDGSHAVDAELDTGIALLAPHFSRTVDWHDQTDRRINATKSYLASVGRHLPIYLQEENRRRFPHITKDPPKEEFFQAAREAIDSQAAGWVFHTDAGFDLSGSRTFFGNLDSVERDVVDGLRDALGS